MLTLLRTLSNADLLLIGTWTNDATIAVTASDPAGLAEQTLRVSKADVARHDGAWLQHDHAERVLSSAVLLALPAPPAAVAVVDLAATDDSASTALVLVWTHAENLPSSLRDDPPSLRRFAVRGVTPDATSAPHDAVRLAAVMSLLPFGVAFVDEDRVEALVNTAAAQWLAIPPGTITALDFAAAMRGLLQRVTPSDESRADAAILASGVDVSVHDRIWELTEPAGAVLRVSSVPVRHGHEVGRLWTFEDISLERALMHEMSQHRELERKLRQSQKLEAVGRLAAGLAHDFNNLLTVISGSTELLRDHLQSDEDRSDLRDIESATTRARRLTRQLLTFTSRQPEHPQVVHLDAHLREIAPLLSKVLAPDSTLTFDWHAPGAHVLADPRSLELAVLNVLANARDAMGTGGRATLRTGVRDLHNVTAYGSALPLRGPHVVISVADAGCGMDVVTLARIFEPFFTTKPEGFGTGLGLATVMAIAQRAGGGVTVSSTLGVGTTVDILLPQVDASVHAAAHVTPLSGRAVAAVARRRALLVDDEAGPRRAVQRLLDRIGFDVQAAASVPEALRLLRQQPGGFDLIMTDQMMPVMNGMEFVTQLRAEGVLTPVLIISGFVADPDATHDATDSARAFLAKPFSLQELIAAIHELLPDVPPS